MRLVADVATVVARGLPLLSFGVFVSLFVAGLALWAAYRNRKR